MEQTTSSIPAEQARFELIDEDVKREPISDATPQPPSEIPPPPSKSPSQPPLSITDSSNMSGHPLKKKGTASTVKKAPKRPNNSGPKTSKKRKPTPSGGTPQGRASDGDEDDEEDNGPYCLCRGPDDHRWMICCEKCEDWFHGECINLSKDIGESLIEKFICPNCTNGNLTSLYKKTCALNSCRKPARLGTGSESVFCSNEHAQTWWERTVAKLPKSRTKGGFDDRLVQGDFMALLESGLSGLGEDGAWKLVKTPFSADTPKKSVEDDTADDTELSKILSEEERDFLDNAAKARFALAEETLLCHKMLTLIEFSQERRRAAITAGRFGEDICGYDQRLDTISARDAFAAFVKSREGEAIFKASKLEDPLGEDDEVRGMCERKRCKVHQGWQKMLVLGIKNQIREMAGQAGEVGEEEKVVREAAGERWRRLRAEKNWVEVVNE
ncbi:hypothetical protein B0T10DRAFT_93709 [Thelonectria olida]|uniref:PHD-type domain-containing protein n=1 Tax=Thelonectria olida TaxID=1576542 RepID=A0A9P9AJD2_9HYPO|nr:hypothetical protein B0T10DRAFT_93709 [Thelonectria olida]